MIPKDKAKELVNKIHLTNKCLNYDRAKTIALICVDEIIQTYYFPIDDKQEWQEVKQEIQKL